MYGPGSGYAYPIAVISDGEGTPAFDADENVAYPSSLPSDADWGGGGFAFCIYLTLTINSWVTLAVNEAESEVVSDEIGEIVKVMLEVDEAYHDHFAENVAIADSLLAQLDAITTI